MNNRFDDDIVGVRNSQLRASCDLGAMAETVPVEADVRSISKRKRISKFDESSHWECFDRQGQVYIPPEAIARDASRSVHTASRKWREAPPGADQVPDRNNSRDRRRGSRSPPKKKNSFDPLLFKKPPLPLKNLLHFSLTSLSPSFSQPHPLYK